MHAHTRAMIAATAFAIVTGKKAAGVHDHTAGHDLQIAAECRDGQVRGFDGDRKARFGGTLPEIRDEGDAGFISAQATGSRVEGYDRISAGFYTADVAGGLVQVYDHALDSWFAYDIQNPQAASSYHRAANEA